MKRLGPEKIPEDRLFEGDPAKPLQLRILDIDLGTDLGPDERDQISDLAIVGHYRRRRENVLRREKAQRIVERRQKLLRSGRQKRDRLGVRIIPDDLGNSAPERVPGQCYLRVR